MDLSDYGEQTRQTEYGHQLGSSVNTNLRQHFRTEGDYELGQSEDQQVRRSKQTYDTYEHNDENSQISDFKSVRPETIIDADQVIYNDDKGIEERTMSYSQRLSPTLRIKTDEDHKLNYASVLVNRLQTMKNKDSVLMMKGIESGQSQKRLSLLRHTEALPRKYNST